MAVSFHSPSARAAQSDLTISISPLGLVELSDEEFEVHGPRLNRYAHAWAMYLGHHWSYRREMGEPQVTFNYTKAFADYINNFCFGNGIRFNFPKATEAINGPRLQRVWDVDNHRLRTLWEMGNQGGVCGDVFVKVAYEEPYEDTIGRFHPGKVRILPLNPSHCFPEWHPHDRTRLTRFKLKYRFWGTAAEGTRQVFTYTEILEDTRIREYVNDEMISDRINPLGMVPVVHIANVPVSGSPWGLSDVQDILPLNREFNEKATDVSDIINYHAEPVTVVTGAKVAQLEKGSNKVWGGLPADARVYNLELEGNLAAPMAYMELLKRGMHEMTGVPEAALGQMQPISNTSGVALSIQFQPLMNRHKLKTIQYGQGLERVNELAILTLNIKEPQTMMFDPTVEGELKPGQYPVLNFADPLTYRTEIEFPPPLPLDVLIKLNEIQSKMAMGLESKRGALRELGEAFPDEKMNEIFAELIRDSKEQGAIDLIRGHILANIMAATGIDMSGGENQPIEEQSAGGEGVSTANGGGGNATPAPLPGVGSNDFGEPVALMEELTTLAYGTKLAQRRNPTTD